MPASPMDSTIYSNSFSDPDVAPLFSDVAEVAAMAAFEAALARAQAAVGVIPVDAVAPIEEAVASFSADLAAMGASTGTSGVPTISLVAQLRAAIMAAGGNIVAASAVHKGATSQDVMDIGLLLRLRDAVGILSARLDQVISHLAGLADTHRRTAMAGRTRSQQAVPVSLGLKAAGWMMPLVRCRDRLAELKPRLFSVQFGGAAGTLAALDTDGLKVMEALAVDLEFTCPPMHWHTQRDSYCEFANWLALITSSLGKAGQDVVLLAQSEVAEVRPASGGGSSTMPQKSNPVVAEYLVTLARHNAGLVGNMHQAAIQEHERGGPGWQLEWLTLPQMVISTAAALRHADVLFADVIVDVARMTKTLDDALGLMLAEAASFALAHHLPAADAKSLVTKACLTALGEGRQLIDVLKERTDVPVDWAALADPANYLGVADQFIDRALKAAE
jgi:3-carboxy-cis,cis-muconate cycloisomerase